MLLLSHRFFFEKSAEFKLCKQRSDQSKAAYVYKLKKEAALRIMRALLYEIFYPHLTDMLYSNNQ